VVQHLAGPTAVADSAAGEPLASGAGEEAGPEIASAEDPAEVLSAIEEKEKDSDGSFMLVSEYNSSLDDLW
jgi:hypothetical protein